MYRPLKPYGLSGDFFKNPSKYNLPPVFEKELENGLKIYGLNEKLKRVIRYCDLSYPIPKKDYIKGFKMFMARNQGSGNFGETLSLPILAKENELCTETFVVIGLFESNENMQNCLKYIKTKFFRTLLSIKKNDQSAAQGVYKYIPLQDFTFKSDINWNTSIEEIDKQLYSKYNLSIEEIKYIEDNVETMK